MLRLAVRIVLAAVVALGPSAAASAQPAEKGNWMPPEGEEILVKQLAGLLKEAAPAESADEAALMERARAAVRRQRARVEAWSEKGLLERTPDLARLGMPKSGDAVLDAIGHYQMCNAILYMRHVDRARESDPAARLAAVDGLNAMTLAVLYLGRDFLLGGNQARMEGFLTGPEMEAILNRIQDRPELREYAAGQCRPVVTALIAG